ncbi:hypothetical protein GCM10009636_31620 [Arthrobacter koreensis]
MEAEVLVLDQGVDREDAAAVRRGDHGGIVARAQEHTRPSQSGKDSGQQFPFAKLCHCMGEICHGNRFLLPAVYRCPIMLHGRILRSNLGL